MQGVDNYGNVQFTGYYTPVVQARHTRQGEFQYPIYRMPPKRGKLPSRASIYAGALSDNYVLAYSNSLMDNFIMDVQGSGYIDFGDGSPLNFFSYAGKKRLALSQHRQSANRPRGSEERRYVDAGDPRVG